MTRLMRREPAARLEPMQPSYEPSAGDDPVLSDEAVLDIVRRHVPGARRVTAVDESGRKARAYFIDGAIVLKTRRPVRLRSRPVEEFETSLAKEAFFLAQMARDAGIRAPRPLGSGHEGGIEYVCMTRMPGVSLRRAQLNPEQRAEVLKELGLTLRRIHCLSVSPFAASDLFPDDGTPTQLRARLEVLFARMARAIAELPAEWRIGLDPRDVAAKALAGLSDPRPRAVLHSNPAGEHVFVDPESGCFEGLIDFGDAYVSHPALDLRPWREPDDRAAIIAGYTRESGVDDGFLATWRAGLILGLMAALLRRREPPRHLQDLLRQVLAEL